MTEAQLQQLTKSNWVSYRKSLDDLIDVMGLIATRRREEASTLELEELSSLVDPYRAARDENREVWMNTLDTLRIHGYMPADFLGEEQ